MAVSAASPVSMSAACPDSRSAPMTCAESLRTWPGLGVGLVLGIGAGVGVGVGLGSALGLGRVLAHRASESDEAREAQLGLDPLARPLRVARRSLRRFGAVALAPGEGGVRGWGGEGGGRWRVGAG